jgi:hypothetical protein
VIVHPQIGPVCRLYDTSSVTAATLVRGRLTPASTLGDARRSRIGWIDYLFTKCPAISRVCPFTDMSRVTVELGPEWFNKRFGGDEGSPQQHGWEIR